MIACALARRSCEPTCPHAPRWIDQSDWHSGPGKLDWEGKVAVVANDNSRIDLAGQKVDEQV